MFVRAWPVLYTVEAWHENRFGPMTFICRTMGLGKENVKLNHDIPHWLDISHCLANH